MAYLQILMFSGKCQTSCMVLRCEQRSHSRMSGPHATLMESVSDSLVRNMHKSSTGGHFVELWQCSSCSSSHKGADSDPAAGLLPIYGPLLVEWPVCWYRS
ncbi:hypothetical protein VZT92_022357 [Zoarces viviparus]|uniref:Uncharacterized protein n=1 Tax=Zoarces viviparus TaxID=48416 RepID=A0AAW1EB71_ZOAVI